MGIGCSGRESAGGGSLEEGILGFGVIRMARRRRPEIREATVQSVFISVHLIQTAGYILPVADAQCIGFPDALLDAFERVILRPRMTRSPGGILLSQGFDGCLLFSQDFLPTFLAEQLSGGYIVHEIAAAAAFVNQFHRFFLS